MTPHMKLSAFISCHECANEDGSLCVSDCLDELEIFMAYSQEDAEHIDLCTRGQHENPNWHVMRKHLLTASNFMKVKNSTNVYRSM